MPPSPAAPLRIVFRLAAVVLAAGLSTLRLSSSAATEPERVFTVRGVIRGPFDDGTIRIQHEAIPNFMPAMTMPFYVEQTDIQHLRPGDHVEFEFRVGDSSRATKFRKLSSASIESPAATPPPVGRSAASPADPSSTIAPSANPSPAASSPRGAPTDAPRVRRLRPGDAVPAFSLTTQASQPFNHAALRDRHTVLTFIFTRCPVPEFCPLIGQKFQALQRALAGRPDVRLLSITIDPEHDQPAVLRGYAETLGADPDRWTFATGEPAEIEKLTRLFAVRTERNAATLDHTLATALVGPDGNIVEIWRGNGWKPEEILARLP